MAYSLRRGVTAGASARVRRVATNAANRPSGHAMAPATKPSTKPSVKSTG